MEGVVDFDAHRPHEAGPVTCARCQHQWISVRPVGTEGLECPKCGAMAGHSLAGLLGNAKTLLASECCGQVDHTGTCAAPACIYGDALKLVLTIKRAVEAEYPTPPEGE